MYYRQTQPAQNKHVFSTAATQSRCERLYPSSISALGSRSVSPGCFSLEQPAPVDIAGVAPLYIRRNTLSSSLFSLSRWHSRTIITTTAYRTTLPLADPAHRWTIRCRWYDPLRRCGNSVRDFRAGGGRRWRHLLCRDPPGLAVTILPIPGPYLAGRWMAIECTGERSGAWDYIPFTCGRRPRDLSLYICRWQERAVKLTSGSSGDGGVKGRGGGVNEVASCTGGRRWRGLFYLLVLH